MNIEKIFRKIPKFKNIHLDTVLFESRYPILFTCVCGRDVYLFVCCLFTNEVVKWIGTKTNDDILIKLLENKITIRDSFVTGNNKKIMIDYKVDGVHLNELFSTEIPPQLLPTVGEYMEAEEGEYFDEISHFKKRLNRQKNLNKLSFYYNGGKMGKEWIKIKETGQLYLEKILVTFDIPILFVCHDFENRKYLCLNIDDENGTTVIAETDNEMLVAMLQDKVTMESVFRKAANGKLFIAMYDLENEEIVTQIQNSEELSEDFLPQKEAFLELNNQLIYDYLEILKKQLIKINNEKFYENKTIIIHSNNQYVYYSAGNETTVNYSGIKLTETKQKCLYGIIDNKKMIA